ncbi:MAG: response regulator [Bacteroidetes bacterium]|nr:response regulator [Bacteroidota bacterium]MCW5897391.1 response regulator [Bacteroidota bacterium]
MEDKQLTILISEDEVDINNLLTLVLQLENFNVLQAFDGLTAYETFLAHKDEIDLVVTDLGLPKMGGVELIEKVRGLKPTVKIIGASGFGRVNVREEVMKAGADEFMPKPYITADLLLLAKKLLGRS